MPPCNQDFEPISQSTADLEFELLGEAIRARWKDEKDREALHEYVRHRSDHVRAQQENGVPAEDIFTHIRNMNFNQ